MLMLKLSLPFHVVVVLLLSPYVDANIQNREPWANNEVFAINEEVPMRDLVTVIIDYKQIGVGW